MDAAAPGSAPAPAPGATSGSGFPVELDIDRRRPRAPQIYEALREAILDLRLLPGTPISENRICQQTVVSRTPVREAIIRLAQEDLIAVFPQQGSFVAPIRVRKVIEGSFIRESLEMAVLRLASTSWSDADAAGAQAIIARQREFAKAGDHRAFFREDQAFHTYFAGVAGMDGVTRVIADAATHVVRVRRLATPVKGHMERAIAEHEEVLEHLQKGAVPQAVATLHRHLSRVYSTLAKLSQRHPDYFDGPVTAGVSIPPAMRHL
jgi:DNA-binding GntR family transcriptional regulator